MYNAVTGIILAGGKNKRFGGENKAFLRVGEKRIMDRVYDVMRPFCYEIVIAANNPLDYLEWGAKITTDIFSDRSSLTGLHAGLTLAQTPHAFVCACDAPFLKKAVVKTILEAIDSHIDIVVPETEKGLEPLCAVYSKRCLPMIELALARKNFAIRNIYNMSRVKTISEKALRRLDPELASFFNVNTPEDLKIAEAMAAMLGSKG